jgi:acyl dehydratase
MPQYIPLEKVKDFVGEDIGVSQWHTITQEDVNSFADITHDHQFIHIDEEKAKGTPFGGTIAHGYLSLSLLPYLMPEGMLIPENLAMGVNYGLNKVRFLQPVRVGSEVRARGLILDVTEKDPKQVLITSQITLEIKGVEKPALMAETLGLFFTQ